MSFSELDLFCVWVGLNKKQNFSCAPKDPAAALCQIDHDTCTKIDTYVGFLHIAFH